MKFFIDECLSPQLARRLNDRNLDAFHPLDLGRRGEADHIVVQRCIQEDRIIVTGNARDFRALERDEFSVNRLGIPKSGRF